MHRRELARERWQQREEERQREGGQEGRYQVANGGANQAEGDADEPTRKALPTRTEAERYAKRAILANLLYITESIWYIGVRKGQREVNIIRDRASLTKSTLLL